MKALTVSLTVLNTILLLALAAAMINQDQRDLAFRRLSRQAAEAGRDDETREVPRASVDEKAHRESEREEAARRGWRDSDETGPPPSGWTRFRFQPAAPKPGDPPGTERFEAVPVDPTRSTPPTPQKPQKLQNPLIEA